MSETQNTATEHQSYYVPEQSKWPILMSVSVFVLAIGLTLLLNSANSVSLVVFIAGLLSVIVITYAWFRSVAFESMANKYSGQVDDSFRWGMYWFIFSEVMFFAAFFGSLYYTRSFSLPWLAGESGQAYNQILWPDFIYTWPLLINPDAEAFVGPKSVIGPLGLPLINTILLITSSFTVSFAHKALKYNKINQVSLWLFVTVLLGVAFLFFQGEEYVHAYKDLGLTLDSGVYGSLFFMLTGFHGLHVTLGTIMLVITLLRVMKGHYTAGNHFGFEAVAWYWHFVDVVWIGLFIFVYII